MSAATTSQRVPQALAAAQRYVGFGWAVVPVPFGRKVPVVKEWQELRLTAEQLPEYFSEATNIGVLTGAPSQDLTDVDLDVPEALALAAIYLRATQRIHGRQGNPRSHWWYYAAGAKYEKFDFVSSERDAQGKRLKTCIVEIRGDGGHQTLVPPSRHPDGDTYKWHELGDPTPVDAAELHTAAARIAAGAIIARAWPGVGTRDDAALALSGMLLRAGWTVEDADRFVVAVAEAAGDEQARSRAKGKRTRADLDDPEKHVYGKPRLVEVLTDGANVVEHVERWLALPKASASVVWDDPVPLTGELPPVAALDMDMLPAALRGFVWDIAERMQAPVDYPAVAVLVAAGAVIGRRVGIHPKRQDDWTVTPTPWGGLIGPSGWGKTPSMSAAMKPLDRLIAEARKALEDAKRDYEAEKVTAEICKAALLDDMRKAAKDKNSAKVEELRGVLAALPMPQEPKACRYRTNDTTVEKLAELLIANPAGLLVFRDELMGWLRTMDKQGHEADRAFYNECWGGTSTNYEVDRIGRGSIIVPALCVSVLGGIQPGPLRSYVYAASDNNNVGADGFLQRFQLLVWPDAHKAFKVVDRWPDKDAKAAVRDVFARLAQLDSARYGAVTDDEADPYAIPTLRFSDEAQALFYEWWQGLEVRIRSGELPDAFTSHLAKYRSLMPALALLFHLIDADPTDSGSVGFVGEAATLQAIAWCEYLETHANRVYASAASPSMERASALLKRIKRGEVVDGCSVRDIYVHGWERLQSLEETEDALQTLEAYGWLCVETVPAAGAKGGRPTKIVRLHPSLRTTAKPKGGTNDGDDD